MRLSLKTAQTNQRNPLPNQFTPLLLLSFFSQTRERRLHSNHVSSPPPRCTSSFHFYPPQRESPGIVELADCCICGCTASCRAAPCLSGGQRGQRMKDTCWDRRFPLCWSVYLFIRWRLHWFCCCLSAEKEGWRRCKHTLLTVSHIHTLTTSHPHWLSLFSCLFLMLSPLFLLSLWVRIMKESSNRQQKSQEEQISGSLFSVFILFTL